MKADIAEILFDLLQGACLDVDLREDYSGRGMYGDKTWAISGEFSHGDVAIAVASAYDLGYVEQNDDITPEDFGYRTDNMGLGIVIY